jgi:HEPN domain-containing protein
VTTVPDRWWEKASYDLETAKAMLVARRFDYVLFCCQQALEKALRALFALRTGELPPRLHSLTRLADVAGVKLPEETAAFFRLLTGYYVESRYPDDPAAEGVDQAVAAKILSDTEQVFQWLFSTR